jgi:hypothetical protein
MKTLVTLFCLLICGSGFSQLVDFPNDFSEQAFVHVEKLCSFGQRTADSKSMTQTTDYLLSNFKQSSLETAVDTFEYKYFDSKDLKFKMAGHEYHGKFYFNPYSEDMLEGVASFIEKDTTLNSFYKKDVSNTIIITNQDRNRYEIAWIHPKALVVVSDSIFKSLAQSAELKVEIPLTGAVSLHQSVNVIGTLNPQLENEIIISAHWDSFNGPGALDNASGVAVMLELARYFSKEKPNFKMQFVAFGTEELGTLGAKAFVIRHKEELKKCKLVFNIDEAGGHKNIYIEMLQGVRDLPKENEFVFDLKTANLAETDYLNGWFLNDTYLETSNVPAWLSDMIKESCKELGMEFIPSGGMGSDHQVLFQSGVVASNICYYGGINSHSPEDLPERINKNGLEKTGKIVALTVEKVMKKY